MSSLRVWYISLEISERDKEILNRWVKENIDEKDFCYLKLKGGNVINKAHLTLDFGINLSEKNKLDKDDNLKKFINLKIKPKGLEIFKFKECDALVLLIDDFDGFLNKWHRYFKENYKHYYKFKRQNFKPHVTLAYVKKGFEIEKVNYSFPKELTVKEAKIKLFGPRFKSE